MKAESISLLGYLDVPVNVAVVMEILESLEDVFEDGRDDGFVQDAALVVRGSHPENKILVILDYQRPFSHYGQSEDSWAIYIN